MSERRWICLLASVLALAGAPVLAATIVGSAAAATEPPYGPPYGPPYIVRAPTKSPTPRSSTCADRHSSKRDPANPLMLSTPPPASDPLAGARFFVDGPAHGAAAGAIARLLGADVHTPIGSVLPGFAVSESWATFQRAVTRRLAHASRSVVRKVLLLEKIAVEPEAQRISVFSAGGTPAGISAQTTKLFCHNFTADPGSIPIISTYFLHPVLGGCATTATIDAYAPLFRARIDAMAQATGKRPAVYLVELDAIGSSSCIAHHHALPAWEGLLRYEAETLEALPHTAVYIEGGYSDANSPGYAARILNASGIGQIQGFFTNDTHINWTINEIRYGEAISKRTHGAHFIIDTADNGNGPLRNRHLRKQGIEDLCNPPGRALGPQPTTSTGYPHVDAFLWTHVPGNSSGCGGGPPSGDFWPARAIGLAARANGRLGPHFPSAPY